MKLKTNLLQIKTIEEQTDRKKFIYKKIYMYLILNISK